MKKYECSKCGEVDVFLDKRGTQTAVCCADCGKWIKWAGKNEIALLNNQGTSNNNVVEFIPDATDGMTDFENGIVFMFENNFENLMRSLMKHGPVTNDFKELMLDRLTDSMKEILRL